MLKSTLLTQKKIYVILLLFVGLLSFANNPKEVSSNPVNQKGIFTIQFSWNSESYDNNVSIEILYKKKGFLSKSKASGKTASYAGKNEFINIELADGEYEFEAIKIRD